MTIAIRESTGPDLRQLLDVERRAFGEGEGPEIVEMVCALLEDPTAKPLLSLVALSGGQVVGHILFTRAGLNPDNEASAAILAPLAVSPEEQNRGVGGKLIGEGLRILASRGVELIFVLGHPEYYPRYGFRTAGELGFDPPYPVPARVAGAWMVQELVPGVIGRTRGRVLCAEKLDRPEYWQE